MSETRSHKKRPSGISDTIWNKAVSSYSSLVDCLKDMGYSSPTDIRNFDGTPERVAYAMVNEWVRSKADITEELDKACNTEFPMPGDPGIVITDAKAIGVCPHHLSPVIHNIYVGYMPDNEETVLGISKLIRIVKALAARPILQEQLGLDIAATLHGGFYKDLEACGSREAFEDKSNWTGFPYINSQGSFCIIGSTHTCVCTRGAHSDSLMRTSEIRGIFREPAVKSEALSLISIFPSSLF